MKDENIKQDLGILIILAVAMFIYLTCYTVSVMH